jgi:hypothetical protein
MSLFKVLQLQLDPAARAFDRFSVRRGEDFFFLNDPSADMKKTAARMLFIQGI